MKKRFVKFLSILLSVMLALECIPQTSVFTLPVQAAQADESVISAIQQEVEELPQEAEETPQTDGSYEDEPPLTDDDVSRWMEENGLGSGRLITGEGEEAETGSENDDSAILPDKDYASSIDDVYYRANISVDGGEPSQMALKDAFYLAQTKSKSAVPKIVLRSNMYVDEPIKISKGKTVHLVLSGKSVFRGPSGTGKENNYYYMDVSERKGNIFTLEEDAKLIITGGKLGFGPRTDTRFTQKGVTFRESEKTYTYKTGRLVGGYNTGHGGAIFAAAKSTVDLRDLTIVNCAASSCGGAIYAESQANVQLSNTKIVGNYANDDGGGIYMNGARGVLNMDNDTEITGNRAARDGGAICLDSSKIIVCGYGKTDVSGNLAVKNGGAVYLPDKSSNTVRGIRFTNNVAQKYGGSVYFNGSGSSVADCVFENNYSKMGGGIYVNAKDCGVSSVTMTKNKAEKEGGAVWVDSQDDLGLSGTVVIKDNISGSGTRDNVALQDGLSSTSYLALGGALGAGSEVWVHTSNGKRKRLSLKVGNYDARQFHADKAGSHVEYKNRHLYIEDGAETNPEENHQKAKVTEITYSDWKTRDITKAVSEADGRTSYTFTGADGASYPVYYGYVSSPSHTTEDTDIVNKYYYSDGFFFGDPKKYDNHLAAFGMNFAMASADSYINTHDDYRYKFTNIKSLMQQIGIAEENIYVNSWYTKKPTDDSIGVAIGKKTIRSNAGEEYTLVPIAIRSYGYEKEWASNMTINGENTDDMKDEHSGFKSARTHVMDELKYYIANYGLSDDLKKGKVKFFVTGFSRGSATANLTGKFLVDTYGENSDYQNKNQIFAYCFAVPAGGTDFRDNTLVSGKSNECYYCVHNIINKVDLTPMVATYEMGFKRYGVDHYVPGDPAVKSTPVMTNKPSEIKEKVDNVTLYYDNDPWYVGDENYKTQREKMVKQLLAVNDELDFVDFFKEYYITMGKANYFWNGEPYTFNKARTSNKKLENWLPEFYYKLQKWNILASDKNLSRENYSKYVMKEGKPDGQWSNNGTSVQDALRGLVQLMLSKTPEEKSKLSSALSGVVNKINAPIIGSGNTMLTLYHDLIGDDAGWDKSTAIQQKWLDEIWGKLTDNRYGQQGIQDVMTPSELKEFKSYYPTLMGVVFRLLKYDYDNAGKVDSKTKAQMWIAGTFAKNSEAVLQGHVPEIALAWLRSYDNWYDNDVNKIAYTGSGSKETTAPAIKIKTQDGQYLDVKDNETLNGEKQTIYLPGDTGDAVFYVLEKDGKESGSGLYNGCGITISEEGRYKLTAYAISDYAAQTSKPNGDSYWSKKWKDSAKTSVSFNLETVAARKIFCKESEKAGFKTVTGKEGSKLSLHANYQSDGRPFLRWKVTEDEAGSVPYTGGDAYGFTQEALKNNKLECMIPDRTVYIVPVYAGKTVSIESISMNKIEVGKELPKVTSLTYKDEGDDTVWTYPEPGRIITNWDEVKSTETGEKKRYPVFPGSIAKDNTDYILEIVVPVYRSETQNFAGDENIAVNCTIPGYNMISSPGTVSLNLRLTYEATEKIPGESPVPLSSNKVHLKRTLTGASDSEKTAFEGRINSEYGSDGLSYTADKGQLVTVDTDKLLFDNEEGYTPVCWKVIPGDLRLYDEDGEEIPLETWEDAKVIEDEEFTFRMPESDFTLEAVYAYTSTIKEFELVIEQPETGSELSPTPLEAKIRLTKNKEDTEIILDPESGFTIEYTPEADDEEGLAAADTAYSASVSMKFGELKDKESGKTLKEILGYSYDGIKEINNNIKLIVKDDQGEPLEPESAGFVYEEDGDEYPVFTITGYAFDVELEPTMSACILQVYDESAWFTAKKDAASGRIVLEEQFDDGFDGKRSEAADWTGLSKLLPDTVIALTDEDYEEYLEVTWEKPESGEFRENTMGTQIFELKGKAAVPEDMLVYDYDTDKAVEKDSLDVWCDVIIESSESAEKPYAMPAGTTYYDNVSVTLGSETEGATIWYTLDGSEPVDEWGKPSATAKNYNDTIKTIKPDQNSEESYTVEDGIYIDTPGETVLKAAALKDGTDKSETLTERYTIIKKPEAEFPEEDLDTVYSLSLEEGMCLDDLTWELPDNWSWHEDQDIYEEYWLDGISEDDPEDDTGCYAYGLLVYNPDPEKYEDAYIEVAIPIYGETYFVDVFDGAAFDEEGDPLYEALEGESVYLVADYPMEMDESYEFEKWIAADEEGKAIEVKMAGEDEDVNDYPEPLKSDDGAFFDGAASFIMPDSDVVIKAVFKKYDDSGEGHVVIEEKTVESLSFDKTELKLKAGDEAAGSGTLVATVSFNGIGKEPALDFRCSASDVVRMTTDNNTVNITALKEGEATIWAGCGDKIAQCRVIVEPGPADAVNVTVKNGKALDGAGKEVNTAIKGAELTLKADSAPGGYIFKKWDIKGTSKITGSTAEDEVKITVGTRDIAAEAVFEIDPNGSGDFTPKDISVPVKKLTLSDKEKSLTVGYDFTLTATAVYDKDRPEIEFVSSNPYVASVTAGKTKDGSAQAMISAKKPGEAVVTAYCGNKKAECIIYIEDISRDIVLEYDDGDEDALIELKTGEQLAMSAVLMPETSLKQVDSVKYQVLTKFDKAKLNAPLKDELDKYPELEALNGQKLPKIAGMSGGLLTAKWDKNLTKAGKTSAMTVLRVTMKLAKEKGRKKAVEYVNDYPVTVTATDYETKDLKNVTADKSYSLKVKVSDKKLDKGIEGKGTADITATISKAEKKDSIKLQYISTNEDIISVENAQETAVPDADGKKAAAGAKLKANGIGTAYVIVRSVNTANESEFNQSVVKVTVISSSPKLRLLGDSENLLPAGESGKKPENGDTVEITMRRGSYDRFYVEVSPDQSTDAPKLKWSAAGGVTVKNGVVFAGKATKPGKPAKVMVKCSKRKPITILINVK